MLPLTRASGQVAACRPFHYTKSGVVHRKKCRHPKTPADLVRRFCLVCGCKAENYNFGVISCESCKAFFRRNAHKKMLGEAGFACSYRRGGCDVNAATRKKCPGCRLAKCFAVGMQADLIQRMDSLTAEEQMTQSLLLSQPPQSSSSSSMGEQSNQPDHLALLWQQLQTPASAFCQPLTFTEAVESATERHFSNTLLVDFYDELRRLVRDTILGDIAPNLGDLVAPGGGINNVALLEAFVHQSARFIAGLRQVDQLERDHVVTLLRCRLHSVLFPVSCAGFSHLDGRFYFTAGGRRVCCQPIQVFCDLVRESSCQLVDYTPLADFESYTRQLLELTEMRPELLALFCAAKLLCLPPEAECPIGDNRMRDACARLAERYHDHLVDSLFYHYPFEFESKLRACCRLFKWSLEFDRTLESFIHYCPIRGGAKIGQCSE